MKTTLIAALAAALALGGCASQTPTREVSVAYVIYDIQPGADVSAGRIAEAVKTALQRNTTSVRITNAIPPSPLPDAAPRFQLVSPFKGGLAALAAANGAQVQVPTCEGAILSANAADTSMRKYSESTTFFVCVMPYKGGYAMDIYTTFSKASGGFSPQALGAALAHSVVGDSSQFIPRTIASIVTEVQQTGATVKMTDAYPTEPGK